MTQRSFLFVGGSLHGKLLQLAEPTPWFHYSPPVKMLSHSPTDAMMGALDRATEVYERTVVTKEGRHHPYTQYEYHLHDPAKPPE